MTLENLMILTIQNSLQLRTTFKGYILIELLIWISKSTVLGKGPQNPKLRSKMDQNSSIEKRIKECQTQIRRLMDVLYSDNEPKLFVAGSDRPDPGNEESKTFRRKQIWDTVRKEYSKYCIKESLDESTQLYIDYHHDPEVSRRRRLWKP